MHKVNLTNRPRHSRGVNHDIHIFASSGQRIHLAQIADDPLEIEIVDQGCIARRPHQQPQLVTRFDKRTGHMSPDESTATSQQDAHDCSVNDAIATPGLGKDL